MATSHTEASRSSFSKAGPHVGEFTPGPWRVAPARAYTSAPSHLHVDAGARRYVCEAGMRGDVVAEADARLIAAAPDMLASLVEIIAACDACGKDDDLSLVDTFTQEMEDRARAAISKATGA